MARNGSGTHSLPTGNPVVTGTAIDSTVHNATMADISSEITASLSRNGDGGMLAALRGVDGSVSAPAFSFTSETGTGLYRAGSNDVRLSIGGTAKVTQTATTTTFATKVIAPDGSAASPGVTPTSETNMGMYRSSAGVLGFAVGGAEHLAIGAAQISVKSKPIVDVTATADTVTWTTDWATVASGTEVKKCAGLVVGQIRGTATVGTATWDSIATLSSGFRPAIDYFVRGVLYDGSGATKFYGALFEIKTTGVVAAKYYDNGTELTTPPAIGTGDAVFVTFSFVPA